MRMLFGSTNRNMPSRFLKEIPEEFYSDEALDDEEFENQAEDDEEAELYDDDVLEEEEIITEKKTRKHIFNERTEISLEDARKISGKYNLGDIVEIEVKPKNFGRISAQTAKQVIMVPYKQDSTTVYPSHGMCLLAVILDLTSISMQAPSMVISTLVIVII